MGLIELWFLYIRVSYRDGVMEHEPQAIAAVKGTRITVIVYSFIKQSGSNNANC